LHKNKTNQFFLFLYFSDPNYNYFLHKEYDYYPDYQGRLESKESIIDLNKDLDARLALTKKDIEFLIACYDSEISYTDQYIGIILEELKELGLYDNSIIILISDHGQEFMERAQFGNGHSVYQELIHVPLIVKLPEQRNKNKVVENYVSLIDIMPSLINFLEFRMPENLEGKSLDFIKPEDIGSLEVFSVCDNFFNEEDFSKKSTIILNDKKLIMDLEDKSLSLFNLKIDPHERYDLSDENSEEADKLRKILIDWTYGI